MAYLSLSRPALRSHQQPPKGLLARFFAVWKQRQHLDRLDQHMLRDIGVTPFEAHREANRGLWDAPSNWR